MPPPAPTDLPDAGCALLPAVCTADDCVRMLAEWHAAQQDAPADEQMRRESGELNVPFHH